MSVSISDNPAVTNPKGTLTKTQLELLGAIMPKLTRPTRSGFLVRGKIYRNETIGRLKALGLVKDAVLYGRPTLELTMAGKIAVTRINSHQVG